MQNQESQSPKSGLQPNSNKKRIRVLHTIRQGSFGGGETYLFNLVNGLDPEIYESSVLSFTEGNMTEGLRKKGIDTHVIYTETPFDARVWPKVYALMKRLKPDLLHIHGTRAGSNTIFPAKMLGIPALYTVHGWSFHAHETSMGNSFRIMTERLLAKMAKITACGSYANEIEGKKYGVFGNYRIVRNGIVYNNFKPGEPDEALKQSLGIKPGELVILSLARITLQKDPLTMLKGFAHAAKQVPNAKMLYVGGGELEAEVKALTKALNLEDRVIFAPFTNNIAGYMNLADVFVLPSLWEVLSLALMEAMAMQRACLCSDIDSNQELLTNEKDGLTFKLGNAEDLGEKLVRLCNDAGLRQRLAAEARITIKEKFDISRVVRENAAVYSEILKG
ncbi:MAG: glycosyltransferase family 4 protein [Bacteroidota bacterium]